MDSFEISYRVTYSDTDQMGMMHHSNYLRWYENARWELFRQLGIPYATVEREGIIFPVTEINLRYHHPLVYDQEVRVIIRVRSVTGARITFEGEMHDGNGRMINGSVIRVGCARKSDGKACPLPGQVRKILAAWMGNRE
ncbi:MAG: acyl-CoA thioesterase [Prolixibacteraceae bacterium]|jgi:acyl-CoA thioester hydrolase|nr:acyl-CoA thioesterase [Prolixibacteraceae bacterium]